MYTLKTLEHYNNIKKIYKSDEILLKIWNDVGSPRKSIGDCIRSVENFLVTNNDKTLENFLKYYLENTKSEEDIKKLVETLYDSFKLITNNKEVLDKKNIFDLIILHAVIETYNGKKHEIEVEKYFTNKGCKIIRERKLDCDYHIDFLVKNKKYGAIQVKPISFFIGKTIDLMEDKERAIDKFKKFVNSEDNKYNFTMETPLYFMIYKNNDFLNINKSFLLPIKNNNDYNKFNWKEISKNKKNWKKLNGTF